MVQVERPIVYQSIKINQNQEIFTITYFKQWQYHEVNISNHGNVHFQNRN